MKDREDVYLNMPYGAFGDQLCFLGAARIYAKRHPEQRCFVSVLPELVMAYNDCLLLAGIAGRRIDFECVTRHRVKNSSPDRNYVGTYLAALGEPVTDAPAFEPPTLPPHAGLTLQGYIAIQPYSTFARNAEYRDWYVQSLIDMCHEVHPELPVICVGRPDTRRDLKNIDYRFLGWSSDVLRTIAHARYVLTPRSASAHIAAGYRVPSFVWVCGDGEDWHLDYPDWPHVRVSVDHSPIVAAAMLKDYFLKGTKTMGEVSRVLAERNGGVLQNIMHDRIVLESCENIHFHWRNVRLEMSLSDAARMLDIFWWGSSKIMASLKDKVVSIPLDAICPYNNSHMRLPDGDFENESPKSTADHHAGVEWMAEQIKAGRKIRPIAVRPAWHGRFPRPKDKRSGNIWQRLDGFKRYMAHRKLGLRVIDCYVFDADVPGCQDSMSAFVDGEALPRAFQPGDFTETGTDALSIIVEEKQRYGKNEVELLKNGLVHVHMGDARLEFDQSTFRTFAAMIGEAAKKL